MEPPARWDFVGFHDAHVASVLFDLKRVCLVAFSSINAFARVAGESEAFDVWHCSATLRLEGVTSCEATGALSGDLVSDILFFAADHPLYPHAWEAPLQIERTRIEFTSGAVWILHAPQAELIELVAHKRFQRWIGPLR